MTDIDFPLTDFATRIALRLKQSVERLRRLLARIILARATDRALSGLPDDLLADIGLTRGDIPFVLDAVASDEKHVDVDALDRINENSNQPAYSHRRRAACASRSRSPSASRDSPGWPLRNKVSGLFGPNEQPTSFVMKIAAPQSAVNSRPE